MRSWSVGLAGGLLAAAGGALGCSGDKLTHVPAPGTRTDTFAQATAQKIDLLWVIDNSGSMADKQAKLANAFSHFIDEFSRGAVDYRIAVTTTDVFDKTPGGRGTLFGSPGIISSKDPDPLTLFQSNVRVGTAGSGNEEGLAGAKAALDALSAMDCPTMCAKYRSTDAQCAADCAASNPPFLRQDAYLYIAVVSDDEDHSASEPEFYVRYLDTIKGLGNVDTVSFSAIVGDLNSPPCSARSGVRYAAVSGATGGVTGSVCDSTFDANVTKLAENAVSLKRRFLLGKAPDTTTLKVDIAYRCDTVRSELSSCATITDGCSGATPDALSLVCSPKQAVAVPVDAQHPDGFTAGWSFQCSDNSLFFHRDATSDSVPGLRSQVQATYLPAAKGASCGS
jgi:hypothetical protein